MSLVVLFVYVSRDSLIDELLVVFALMIASIVAITVHELGHAGAALVVGSELREISVGSGRPFRTFELLGCRLRIRILIWGGGHVKTVCRTKRFYRTRRIILLLAGVGTEVAYLLLLLLMRNQHHVLHYAARFTIPVVGVSLVSNLWPRNTGGFRTDGGQILDTLRMSEADIDETISLADTTHLLIDTHELIETGRLDQLVQLTEGMDDDALGTIDAKMVRANGLVLAGRFAESMQFSRLARDQLATDDPTNLDGLAAIENLMAYGLALVGDPARMDEAHELANSAFEHRQHPAIGATLGAVLVQYGNPKRGIELLGPVVGKGDTIGEQFETLRFLLIGQLAKRDPLSARNAFLAAHRIAGDRHVRIDELLPALGALEATVWIGRMHDGVALPSAELFAKGRVVLGRSLLSWMSPELASDVRWQLYSQMGGDRSLATSDRCYALRQFADSMLPAQTRPQPQAATTA